MIEITIETKNAAFQDAETGQACHGYEVAAILRRLADLIEDFDTVDAAAAVDSNGNCVGQLRTITADALADALANPAAAAARRLAAQQNRNGGGL